MIKASTLKRNLVITTSIVTAMVGGYARRAFANCYSTIAPNYLCTGANVVQQNVITAGDVSDHLKT